MSQLPTIVISGATGTGKTELSIQIAERIGGEIINADSVQLYRGHRIGGAIPSEQEQHEIPHHLFEILSGDRPFDVKQYVERASTFSVELSKEGRYGVFVGGSTLYLQSLLEGISELPSADEALRKELEKRSSNELYEDLCRRDPERAASLHVNDRVRIIRALEVCHLSGKSFSELCKEKDLDSPIRQAIIIIPVWSRDALYHRIDQRSTKMVQEGIVEETQALSQEFGEQWQSRGALGYAQTLSALHENGEALSGDALARQIAQATRRYAKRQMTFWRNAPKKFRWSCFPDQEGKDSSGAERYIGDESGGVPGRSTEERKGVVVASYRLSELLSRLEQRLREAAITGNREVWYVDAAALQGDEQPS